jgi:Flavin-binding monooxygenase-like
MGFAAAVYAWRVTTDCRGWTFRDASSTRISSSSIPKEYRNPAQIQKGGVLVVGAGNSGAEIAIELARHHQTWLSGRDTGQEPTRAGSLPDHLFTPIMWFMATQVLTVKNPLGRKVRDYFLDPLMESLWGECDGRILLLQASTECRE